MVTLAGLNPKISPEALQDYACAAFRLHETVYQIPDLAAVQRAIGEGILVSRMRHMAINWSNNLEPVQLNDLLERLEGAFGEEEPFAGRDLFRTRWKRCKRCLPIAATSATCRTRSTGRSSAITLSTQ